MALGASSTVNGVSRKRNGTAPGEHRLSIGGKGCLTKRTTLYIPENVPIDEWKHLGNQIFVISEASTWWLGDWLVYGQAHYPNRYKHAIEETSLDYQTLRNYAWVARKFTPSRRRTNLSFQHHAEVAGLSQMEQEHWLAKAEAGSWTRNELRRNIRESKQPAKAIEPVTRLQLSPQLRRAEKWKQAAEESGMELTEWIHSTLDAAALDTAEPHQVAG